MPAFFIARPVFAWVIAIFICLGGILALPFLPVSQYPIVAPPSISISTSYPGASTQDLYYSVTRLIEEELSRRGQSAELRIDRRHHRRGRDQRRLQARNRPRARRRRRAEPHQAHRAAPAAGRAAAGHRHSRGVHRDPAIRHADLARRLARRDRPRRCRHPLRAAGTAPREWRGPRATVLDRARHARLARSRQDARLFADRGGRDLGHSRAKRPGVLGHAGAAAEPLRRAHAEHGSGEGPAGIAGRVRRHRAARQSDRRRRAAARRRADRSRRPDLRLFDATQRQAGGGHRRPARAHRQCARHQRGRARSAWPSWSNIFRPA